MTFVEQQVKTSHGPRTAQAQTTSCPFLVITPGVDAEGGFAGGFSLTHTLTGLRVGDYQENPRDLAVLAERLGELDWDFDDPEHFKRSENTDRLKAVQAAYWEWEKSHAYQGPIHYMMDPDDVKAARENDPAGTMLAEHIDVWVKHAKALRDSECKTIPSFAENPEARAAHLARSCEAYGLIYLLAVVRAIDPSVADIAARDLVAQYDAGDTMGEWVYQWSEELAAGRPLTLRGIPSGDPLQAFTGGRVE